MAVKFLAPFVIHPEVALYFGPHCREKNSWAMRVNHKVPGSYPYPTLFSRVTCRNFLYGSWWETGIRNDSSFFPLTLISFQNSSFECYLIRDLFFCNRGTLLNMVYPFFRNIHLSICISIYLDIYLYPSSGNAWCRGPEHHLTLTEQFAAQQRLIISWDS